MIDDRIKDLIDQKFSKEDLPKPKGQEREAAADMVNHPPHYTNHPSGVECIELTRKMGFDIGNAWKYLHRAGLKGPESQRHEDFRKAVWYMRDEMAHPFYGMHPTRGLTTLQTSYEFMDKLTKYAEYYAPGQTELVSYMTTGDPVFLIRAIRAVEEAI